MKIVNDKLYLTYADSVAAGISKSENYLSKSRSIGTKCYVIIDDPDDQRRGLIEYESLRHDHKEKVKAKFGKNPHDHVAKQPIRDMVKWDLKAEQFYLNYQYDGGKVLRKDLVEKYTGAASFLNMLIERTQDKKQLKKLLNLSIQEFYNHCCEIIEKDLIDLPTSYRRLLNSCDEYQVNGYASLISGKLANKSAAKIDDEVSEAALIKMISHPNQYDDVLVAIQYNTWAKQEGKKTIDHATVGVWRRKNESEVAMFREGNAKLKNKFLKAAKGFRPTCPTYLIESDDNQLDLLFNDPENPKETKRYVAYVVTDSFNDYVLGYAYALMGEFRKDETIHLIKAAYVNAMYYLKFLTGSWQLPHETKTDRWGLKQLQPFYEAMGKYYPTPVGSKNRGYIEQFFGNHHWKRCLKLGANNYTGNNMTAVKRGVNMEVLALNKKNRPLIGNEANEQIENFFHRLRHLPQSNGISKHNQWMEAWNAMSVENKRSINDEQFLLKFGVEHNHNGEGLRITNKGVQPRIGGQKFNYDLANYRIEDINKSVSVLYDPYDMSRVLVTDHKGFRMMAHDARLNPRALQDCKDTDSRTYLNAKLGDKQRAVEGIAARSDRRNLVLESAGIDAEGLLQAGVMVKEIKQAAEHRLLTQSMGEGLEEDYLEQM